LFRFEELEPKIARASDGRHDISYEDFDALGATDDVPYRRLIEESRNYYRADRLDRILPLGLTEALALPGQNYKLAFTPGLLAAVYRRHEPAESLIPDARQVLEQEGRYVERTADGRWWIPSGRVYYAPHEDDAGSELEHARRHFFLPRRFLDPFKNVTSVDYDRHDQLPLEVRDAIGNTITSEIDYRVLAPWRRTDVNRNRSEVAFDSLGMVAGTAVMGKHAQQAGDSLDEFDADLDESAILEHLAHPLGHPHEILKTATTRIIYDLFAYDRTRQNAQPEPAAVYTVARETHAADLHAGQQTKIQHSFSYSDGFGRQIQKKLQAEPGPLTDGGQQVNPRWVGSGWTIFNNKGKPVRQYEPFFAASHTFEFANIVGVSSILFYDPVLRVVATLHANHTYEKVVFDPWRQEKWDVNDTVLQANPRQDPDVGDFFGNLPDFEYLPTWYGQRDHGQLGLEERRAALQTAVHANTPTVAYADTLGRTFLSIVHNRFEHAGDPVDRYFASRTELDIENNQRAVIDALGRVAMRYDYDMLSTRIRQSSFDAGTRWMLNNAVGKPLLAWDSRSHRFRHEYDALHRPTNFHVRTGSHAEILAERIVYGEGQPNDLALNLRGKPFRQHDGAGILTNESYDFKGNLLRSTRRLLEGYKNEVNWAQSPELEEAVFATATTYDALNRAIALTTPDASVVRPKYNEANLLESLAVNLRGAAEPTPFVTFINYNAKGQREIIDYGNGAHTRYTYDPLTFRMIQLSTRSKHDHNRLQDLHYTFDPVGNITAIRDDAQETIYFKNQVVSPSNDYVYDAIYQLISADGREHAGTPGEPQTTDNDVPRMNYPLPSDGHALHHYREQYEYDAVGNILRLLHSASDGNWSRSYHYGESHPGPENNRLTRTDMGQLVEPYAYDAAGNMTRMPHLPHMNWDFKDQLRATRRQVTNSGRGETTYCVYDSSGQRVRKVTERASGSRQHERIYLGGFEIYRKYDSVGATTLERETLQVLDVKRRIALVETKTIADSTRLETPISRTRFQFDNHLGSAALELDDRAAIITYEEYYPFGSTSFEAAQTASEVSKKRYRYTGKERDDETGLYYHGARYYSPWLGRWTACDPAGMVDGTNVYAYARNNPVGLVDRDGRQSDGELHDAAKAKETPDNKVSPSATPAGSSGTSDPNAGTLVDYVGPPIRPTTAHGGAASMEWLTLGNPPSGATTDWTGESVLGANLTLPTRGLASWAGTAISGWRFSLGKNREGGLLTSGSSDLTVPTLIAGMVHAGNDNVGVFLTGGALRLDDKWVGGSGNANVSFAVNWGAPKKKEGDGAEASPDTGTFADQDTESPSPAKSDDPPDPNTGYANVIGNVAAIGPIAGKTVSNPANVSLLVGYQRTIATAPGSTISQFQVGAEAFGAYNFAPGGAHSGTGGGDVFGTLSIGNRSFGVSIGGSQESGGGGRSFFLRFGASIDRGTGARPTMPAFFQPGQPDAFNAGPP
jgi:RHS repeat-associated protein